MAAKSTSRKPGKLKVTVFLNEDLVQEARGLVIALGFEDRGPRSLSELVGNALEREIRRLRRQYNEGKPFPPYPRPLPAGRPRSR